MILNTDTPQPGESQKSIGDWQPGQKVLLQSKPHGGTRTYQLEKLLGSGKTSLVWEATDLGTASRIALKILRPESGTEFRTLFDTERFVLSAINHQFREVFYIHSPAPDLLDWSDPNAAIQYMAMELVKGVEVASLIAAKSELPATLKEMASKYQELYQQLGKVKDDVYVADSFSEEARAQVRQLYSQAREVVAGISQLVTLISVEKSENRNITEDELLVIGLQSCQAFQVLHEKLRRSYKDFQLKNFYLDREQHKLKILDWNVLTAENDLHVSDDLFHLAASLYYLITHVTPTTGLTVSELRRIGRTAWSEGISLGLRLVLQRALNPNPQARYPVALVWEENNPTQLAPLSSMNSLGGAFALLQRYRQADPTELIELAEQCSKLNQISDTQAALEQAERNMHAEDDPFRQPWLKKRLVEAYQSLSDKMGSTIELLESCKQWLRASDTRQAYEKIWMAIQKEPDNLEFRRWHAAVDFLSKQDYEKFKTIWESGQMQTGLKALVEHNWLKAIQTFDPDHLNVRILHADAQLNLALAQASQQANQIFINPQLDALQKLVDILQNIQQNYIQPCYPDYYQLILNEWPEHEEWRQRAEIKLAAYEEMNNMRKMLLRHPGALR